MTKHSGVSASKLLLSMCGNAALIQSILSVIVNGRASASVVSSLTLSNMKSISHETANGSLRILIVSPNTRAVSQRLRPRAQNVDGKR